MQSFYYQKSSTKRGTNTRWSRWAATADIQGTANPRKNRGSCRSHICTSPLTSQISNLKQCNKTGEKHFCSAVFLFLSYWQKLKEMAVVESFFSNEGTEVTSYNSGQPSSFFMLGGKRQLLYFLRPRGCQLAVLLERIKMQCQGELLEEWD